MKQSPSEALMRSSVMTQIEQTLVQIWKTTLRVDEVRASDNFFALGGDSMTMMQVMMHVREVFGIELDQSLLFQFPTLRELCEIVLKAGAASGDCTLQSRN